MHLDARVCCVWSIRSESLSHCSGTVIKWTTDIPAEWLTDQEDINIICLLWLRIILRIKTCLDISGMCQTAANSLWAHTVTHNTHTHTLRHLCKLTLSCTRTHTRYTLRNLFTCVLTEIYTHKLTPCLSIQTPQRDVATHGTCPPPPYPQE